MPSSDPRIRPAPSVARVTLLAATVLLSGCAVEPPSDAPHGYVEGASEVPEPPLALAELASDGTLVLRELTTGETREIAALGDATTAFTTDGRFVFAADAGSVTIVDTGVWTVDHGDHFHYYRGEPRVVGELTGPGEPTIHAGEVLTTVRFADSAEVRVLDTGALERGEFIELATVGGDTATAQAVPLGELLVLAGTDGAARVVSPDAVTTELARATCPDPHGVIETRVGVVIGCGDGALLATVDRTTGVADLEHIPYPVGTAPGLRADTFDGRLGRPTVAAVAGGVGAWLLDTRERAWQLISTELPLLQVAAVDDAEQHVVALVADGRVLVLDAAGTQLAATAPLLDATLGTADEIGVELTVDAQRAYLNAPVEGVIYEIDYADAARIARTFPAAAAFFAETGR